MGRPWKPDRVRYEVLKRPQQSPKTSIDDQFACVDPGFRCVFSLPHEPAHQCQFQSHTSELLRSFHSERDCNESGTNGIARPYAVLVAQSQTEVRAPKRASESREVSPDRLDERFFVGSPEILRLQR